MTMSDCEFTEEGWEFVLSHKALLDGARVDDDDTMCFDGNAEHVVGSTLILFGVIPNAKKTNNARTAEVLAIGCMSGRASTTNSGVAARLSPGSLYLCRNGLDLPLGKLNMGRVVRISARTPGLGGCTQALCQAPQS